MVSCLSRLLWRVVSRCTFFLSFPWFPFFISGYGKVVSVRPLCSTVCKYSTCFLIFPSPLHGVNIDPAYGKKGRGERRDIRGMLLASPEKERRAKKTFSPTHTRNVLYRPFFKGRKDPSSFSKNTTDFSERKGRRKKNCNGEGGRRESNFPFFPSPAHPCKLFLLLLLSLPDEPRAQRFLSISPAAGQWMVTN